MKQPPQPSVCTQTTSPSRSAVKQKKIQPSFHFPLGVAPFLRSLFRIMMEESDEIIGWSLNGRMVEVRNVEAMTKHVLPRYFRHCKFASFQRQLNYFGFKKLTKSKSPLCSYIHKSFTRDNPKALFRIRRKTGVVRPKSLMSNLIGEKPFIGTADHSTAVGKNNFSKIGNESQESSPEYSPISRAGISCMNGHTYQDKKLEKDTYESVPALTSTEEKSILSSPTFPVIMVDTKNAMVKEEKNIGGSLPPDDFVMPFQCVEPLPKNHYENLFAQETDLDCFLEENYLVENYCQHQEAYEPWEYRSPTSLDSTLQMYPLIAL